MRPRSAWFGFGLSFLALLIEISFATPFYAVDNQSHNLLKDFSSAVDSCHKTFCEPYNEEELRNKPSVMYLRVSDVTSICGTFKSGFSNAVLFISGVSNA